MTAQNSTVALITGANKGIGFETARLLGERGMTVLIGARSEAAGKEAEKTLQDKGLEARFVQLDVTDESSITAAAALIESEYGHLDVLVNNAGIAQGFEPPSGTSMETLRKVFETNVFGIVAVTNAMLPLLRAATSDAGARIVNVSSEVGSIGMMMTPDGPLWDLSSVPYPASKTALNMVTAMYAKEFWDTPIKVNAANPGFCATDLNGNAGYRMAQQGAEVAVHLATLGSDGPTGILWGPHMAKNDELGQLPW